VNPTAKVPKSSESDQPIRFAGSTLGAQRLIGAFFLERTTRAIFGLRSTRNPCTELAEAFSRILDEPMSGGQFVERPNFRVFWEGLPLTLDRFIRDQAYNIGREALINAFRHSHARNIEMNVIYSSSALRLVVRDDGCGIDAKSLAVGPGVHYGLSSMREKADRLGARLTLWSAPGRGTELELSIPGRCAFHGPRAVKCSGLQPLETAI
jgi:signal transduction histidine kinase